MQKIIKSLFLQFLLPFCAVLFIAFPVFSQSSPEEAAKKYNITFPVAELGNCADVSSCRTYCDDPINRTACVDFAKKKGFYKEAPIETKKESVIAAAKKELGCDSETSCKEFCSNQENFEVCKAFAQKNGLQAEPARDPGQPEILKKAKEILNCNSEQACKVICEKEENKEKCSNFAKQAGVRGGERRVGPGGCISEETCKAFCSKSENAKECGFAPRPSGIAPSGSIQGPGGCNSEESCKAYCEKNPQECGRGGLLQPNTGKLTPYPSQPFQKNEKISGSPRNPISPEEYCKLYPGRCKPSGSALPSKPSPVLNKAQEEYKAAYMACTKNPGCYWTSAGCNCSNSTAGKDGTFSEENPPVYNTNSTFGQEEFKDSDQPTTTVGSSFNEGSTVKTDGTVSPEVKGSSTSESFVKKIINFFLTLP
jgi:hypothetical protein